jgi:predicted nucleic acid-binding protein
VWLGARRDSELYIAVFTIAEIRRGILEMPSGRRRNRLEAWFSGPEGPQALFAGRVLPFDESAALHWADLMAEGAAKGRPRSALDMIIGAIARANDCVVATRNERDFWGFSFINPMAE